MVLNSKKYGKKPEKYFLHDGHLMGIIFIFLEKKMRTQELVKIEVPSNEPYKVIQTGLQAYGFSITER